MSCPVEDAIDHLTQKKKSLKCSGRKGLIKTLEGLGFEVTDRKKAGHKIYTHDGLESFYTGSFDCGHGSTKGGAGKPVKMCYVDDAITVLSNYKEELKEYLNEV